MRSTEMIIRAAREGQPVTTDELTAALLVSDGLRDMLAKHLAGLTLAVKAGREVSMLAVVLADDAIGRMEIAADTDPKKWLGEA